jgi:hypothetical protein
LPCRLQSETRQGTPPLAVFYPSHQSSEGNMWSFTSSSSCSSRFRSFVWQQ